MKAFVFALLSCCGEQIVRGQALSLPTSYEVDPSFQAAGFKITTPLDPGFYDAVRSHAPEYVVSAVQSLLPFSFLIENQGKAPVVSVILRYRKTNRLGRTVFSTFRLLSPGGSGGASAIDVGRKRVMLPSGPLSALLGEPKPFASVEVASLRIAAEAQFRADSTRDVVASVDSLVLADGRLVGPDRTDLLREADDFDQAAAYVVGEVRKIFAQGGDRAAIQRFAELQIATAPKLPDDGSIDFSGFARRSLGMSIRSYIDLHGLDGLEKMLADQRAKRSSLRLFR